MVGGKVRKIYFLFILILFASLCSGMVSAFKIIDNSTGGDCETQEMGIWNNATKTCSLTKDINSSIEVDSSHITLDCDGHKIKGKGSGYGVYTYNYYRNYLTIKNCFITNFSSGIYLRHAEYTHITNNEIYANGGGIYNWGSDDLWIYNNRIHSNSGNGIYSEYSDSNTVNNNSIHDNGGTGIYCSRCAYNKIFKNDINSNSKGIGFFLGKDDNNKIYNNTIRNHETGFFVSAYNGLYVPWISVYNNNFVDNVIGAEKVGGSVSLYAYFNHWNDYYGIDDGSFNRSIGDCIGDTEIPHQGLDLNPYIVPSGWTNHSMKCVDGSCYGGCSSTRPLFCKNGTLLNNCQVCGCDLGYSCRQTGVCAPLGPEPTVEWQKLLAVGRGYSVQQTSDGGYIVAGSLYNYSVANYDMYLAKTDSNGNKEWKRTFGGDNYDVAYSVQQTLDGGYIIAGDTTPSEGSQPDYYLVKTDSNGNKEWERTFGGDNYDVAYSVQQTLDGGYIIGGYSQSFDPEARIYIIKTDPNGNKLWNISVNGYTNGNGNRLQQTLDGGYIVVGTTLAKIDQNGNIQWEKAIGTYYEDEGYSVQQTLDGGYVVVGYTSTSPTVGYIYLAKTDSEGNKEWERVFSTSSRDLGRAVKQTSDGGFVITGWNTANPGDINMEVIKTGIFGHMQWYQSFGGSSSDYGSSVQQTSDGGYIVAGTLSSMIHLVKLSGQSRCYDGTPYDQCSITQPFYCDNGDLVNACQICGCDEDYVCQGNGGCITSNITIYVKTESNNPVYNASVFALFSPDNYSLHYILGYTDVDGKTSFDIPQNSDMTLFVKAKGYWDGIKTYHSINQYHFPGPVMWPITTDTHVSNVELLKELSYPHNQPDFKGTPQTQDQITKWMAIKFTEQLVLNEWKNSVMYAEPAVWTKIATSAKTLVMKLIQTIGPSATAASAGAAPFIQALSQGVIIPFLVPTALFIPCIEYGACPGLTTPAFGGGGYTTLSAVDVLITDSEGRKTGAFYINGSFTANLTEIPNSRYSGHGTHPNAIYIPSNITIANIELIPYEEGEYTFQMSKFQNDTMVFYHENGNFTDLNSKNFSEEKLDKFANSPIADAGPDQTVIVGINVTLDGSNSFDINGPIISYKWVDDNGVTLSTEINFSKIFPEGINTMALYVTDEDNITSIDNIVIRVVPGLKITIKQGWNLISVPLNPINNSLNYLFNNTNFTIYTYKNNSWFTPNEIENKLGYWIKVNESKNITLIGTEVYDTTTNLNEGWNLISYPYLTETDINNSNLKNYTTFTYINDSWLSYIPNRTFNSLEILKPGYGYWVNK